MKSMNNILSNASFPACFVELPDNTEGRRAAFYLATEEYIATQLPEENYLFTWQLYPTVVMGRHQVAHQEINLDFCHAEGIDVIRRKSGGGAIFADRNNIMISLITGSGAVEPLFAEYAATVADGLCRLGADVTVSGRNDILLKEGGKVCGNAFYHLPHRNIVHGTMLYDTDLRLMTGALSPNPLKLKSAGVASVRSRIGLLKSQLDCGTESLRQQLRHMLCNRTVRLDDAQVEAITKLEATYYQPEFLFGQTAHADIVQSARIEGCGTLELHFTLKGSLIERVTLAGDFFGEEEAENRFNRAFCDIAFTPEQLTEAVKRCHPEQSIRNLSEKELIRLITSPACNKNQ